MHRHSGSKTVDIEIRLGAGEASITIRDQGCGFSSQQLQDIRSGRSRGVGLTGLRERIAALGGFLEVRSSGAGALIKVILPLKSGPNIAA